MQVIQIGLPIIIMNVHIPREELQVNSTFNALIFPAE